METISTKKFSEPKDILTDALSTRMSANPRYSLRAFARDLKISPQQLSNIINGRKGISAEFALRISSSIGLNPLETDYFLNLVNSQFSRTRALKTQAKKRLKETRASQMTSTDLSVDMFRMVSEWHHLSLIELLKYSKDHSAKTLARSLQIQELEVSQALQRLARLKLITFKKTGRYQVNQNTLYSTDGVPSEAIRKYHKQILQKAITAIDCQSVEDRYVSTTVGAVRREDLPAIRKKMKQFREEILKDYGAEENGENVVALSMQLFNLTETATTKLKGEKNENK